MPRSPLSLAAHLAAAAPALSTRALRLGQVALAAPLALALRQNDQIIGNRALYFGCRGLSPDRYEVLCDEYYEDRVSNVLFQRGRELIDRARAEGYGIVFITEMLEPVARLAMSALGKAQLALFNRLEFRDGVATGALLEPMVGGAASAAWLQRAARESDFDLSNSRAYAAHGPDVMLLSAVGSPCAVNPDFTLMQAARAAQWPITCYDE